MNGLIGEVMATKRTFVRQCERTNGMKTVLTSFHHDIVFHKKDYYNELLDGGVSLLNLNIIKLIN